MHPNVLAALMLWRVIASDGGCSFFYSNACIYIPVAPFPGPPSYSSSSHSSSTLPLRGCSSQPSGLPLPWGPQGSQGLGTSLHLKPDQAVLCCICARGLGAAYECCLVGGSVSGSSLGSELVETALLPMGSLSPSASSILPLTQP